MFLQIGKANVVRSSDKDVVLIIGAGVTLIEALKAADELASLNVAARVIDPFTIKPIDKEGIVNHAKAVGGRVVTVEDHYPEGGLGEAVLSAVAMERNIIVKVIAVPKVPRSGPPNALLELYGISAVHIVTAVKEMLKS